MPRFLFDYECEGCGDMFEELVERDSPFAVTCPHCDSSRTRRLPSRLNIDPKLGVQSGTFSTMADRWEKVRRQRQKIEAKREREHGSL